MGAWSVRQTDVEGGRGAGAAAEVLSFPANALQIAQPLQATMLLEAAPHFLGYAPP